MIVVLIFGNVYQFINFCGYISLVVFICEKKSTRKTLLYHFIDFAYIYLWNKEIYLIHFIFAHLIKNFKRCVACKNCCKILILGICDWLFMTWDLMWITRIGNHGAAGGYLRKQLTQVMACWLTEPNHRLNQCWLVITGIQWHSSKDSFIWMAEKSNLWSEIENCTFKNRTLKLLPGVNKLISTVGTDGWMLLASVAIALSMPSGISSCSSVN